MFNPNSLRKSSTLVHKYTILCTNLLIDQNVIYIYEPFRVFVCFDEEYLSYEKLGLVFGDRNIWASLPTLGNQADSSLCVYI